MKSCATCYEKPKLTPAESVGPDYSVLFLLKSRMLPPSPPPLWICLSRPGQATRPNRAKKWKTINFGISVPIRGWQIALDQNRMENSLPHDFFTISDHRPSTYLMQENRVFEGRNLNYLQRGEDCVWFSMINLKFPDTSASQTWENIVLWFDLKIVIERIILIMETQLV